MLFRSAVDSWFYALVVGMPVVALSAAIPLLPGANSSIILLAIAALLPIVVVPAWLILSTYYRVDSTLLRIQSGPFTWAVPLEQIRAVTPSQSLVSAPALSLNRLRIEYGHQRSVLVSPRRRTAFIEALGLQPADIL